MNLLRAALETLPVLCATRAIVDLHAHIHRTRRLSITRLLGGLFQDLPLDGPARKQWGVICLVVAVPSKVHRESNVFQLVQHLVHQLRQVHQELQHCAHSAREIFAYSRVNVFVLIGQERANMGLCVSHGEVELQPFELVRSQMHCGSCLGAETCVCSSCVGLAGLRVNVFHLGTEPTERIDGLLKGSCGQSTFAVSDLHAEHFADVVDEFEHG